MDRYGIAPQGATISNDGVALGRLDQAERIARDLHAILVRPTDCALTALVAQIRIPIGTQGQVRNIDVLHLLFSVGGLRKSREFTDAVWRDSVEMEWQPGHHLRVMHPLHVLESRVHNAVGLLGDKGPHVLTQARWVIDEQSSLLKARSISRRIEMNVLFDRPRQFEETGRSPELINSAQLEFLGFRARKLDFVVSDEKRR
jgi:hypothetical protein